MGIGKYNEECRAIVMRYAKEWEITVTRLGRWIDFENDYKTLNPSFMESVWWVFGQLWEKGLVYRGFKARAHSLLPSNRPRCDASGADRCMWHSGMFLVLRRVRKTVARQRRQHASAAVTALTTCASTAARASTDPRVLGSTACVSYTWQTGRTTHPSFLELQSGVTPYLLQVMPYSTACSTTLSNFEAGQNYKDVSDPAVMVAFPLLRGDSDADSDADSDGTSFVAWTTTPWTLPSNLALCVHPEFDYVKVKHGKTGSVYIVAEARLAFLPGGAPKKAKKGASARPAFPALHGSRQARTALRASEQPVGGCRGRRYIALRPVPDTASSAAAKDLFHTCAGAAPEPPLYTVLATFKGAELKGARYKPLFDYFVPDFRATAWRVCTDTYVTDDSGTGVVHQAPAFGEDDYRVCIAQGIVAKGATVPCPVDAGGRFTAEVTDFAGANVKDADKGIVAHIKAAGRLVDHSTLVHSYPFCWRSDTPLIYKARGSAGLTDMPWTLCCLLPAQVHPAHFAFTSVCYPLRRHAAIW
jgi:tRNA synthetases class I (I, L, M and V)